MIAPPYDVLSEAEARERVRNMPWNFLHVSRPEIDFTPGTDPHHPRVYEQGARTFMRMLEKNVLKPDDQPYYYVYRLIRGDHEQTGIVAAASVQAYDHGRIKKHELTRPDKETDRVHHIDALNAQTGPAFLTYRRSADIDALVGDAIGDTEPEIDVTDSAGVRHSIWTIANGGQIARLTEQFESVEALYIADGHHRCAAASRVAASRRRSTPPAASPPSYEYFLAVVFPDEQVQILDYNRVIKGLNGLSPEDFLYRVKQVFSVSPSAGPSRPAAQGKFGMYLAGRWYHLALPSDVKFSDDPVRRLDVSVLTERLLEPVLGIHDVRLDERIQFVGGIRGLEALQHHVDSNDDDAVAFALFPTQLEDLLAVADAGLLMPPKSTWFEPKLADGLVSHLLD